MIAVAEGLAAQYGISLYAAEAKGLMKDSIEGTYQGGLLGQEEKLSHPVKEGRRTTSCKVKLKD